MDHHFQENTYDSSDAGTLEMEYDRHDVKDPNLGRAESTSADLQQDHELTKGVCRMLQKPVNANETSLLNQLLQLLEVHLDYLRDCQFETQLDPQQSSVNSFICRIDIPFENSHVTGYGQASTKKEAKKLASRNTIARFVRCYGLEGIEARISDRKTNKRLRSSIPITTPSGTTVQSGGGAQSGMMLHAVKVEQGVAAAQNVAAMQNVGGVESGGAFHNVAQGPSMIRVAGPQYQTHVRPEETPIKINIPVLKLDGEFETVIYEASETSVPVACVQDLFELARDDKVGFDIEYDSRRARSPTGIDLIQICCRVKPGEYKVILIRTYRCRNLGPEFARIFSSMTLVGMSAVEESELLREIYNVRPKGVVDLRTWLPLRGYKRIRNLVDLGKEILGEHLPFKDNETIKRTGWAHQNLDKVHIDYAARDCYIPLKAYFKIQDMRDVPSRDSSSYEPLPMDSTGVVSVDRYGAELGYSTMPSTGSDFDRYMRYSGGPQN